MSQKSANCTGPFMDSSKHLKVGTYGLIDVSNRIASLGTERNHISINGLIVL